MPEPRKQSVAALMSSGAPFPFRLSALPRKCICHQRTWHFRALMKSRNSACDLSLRDQACGSVSSLSPLFALLCSLESKCLLVAYFPNRCSQGALSPSALSYKKNVSIFVVVPLIRRVQVFATPWAAAHGASLSITISQSLLKLMPVESVMPSNRLILCSPLLLLPLVFPSTRVSPNELAQELL